MTLLQHEELSKYIAMSSVEMQHHPCQFPPMCIRLKSHIYIYIYIYIYILCVNFDPQCVWIHVNELNQFLTTSYQYYKPSPSDMHDLILIILLKFQW